MQHDPSRMSIKRGGGLLMLFGLPFFVAGISVIVAAVTGNMQSEDGSSAPLFFVIPFGLVFASVGAGIMFGRAGVTIDLTSRTVTTWWGLLVPFKSTTYPLEKVESVGLSREVRHSKNSTYTVYPVKLKGTEKPVGIQEPRDYASARRRAEVVAKFLDVAIEDTTSGERVVREAGALDESLRERLRRTGEKLEMPQPPPGARTRVTVAGDEATFDVPPAGFGITEYVMAGFGGAAFVGLVIAAAVFFGWVGSEPQDPVGRYALTGFAALFGLVWLAVSLGLIFGAVKSATSREFVTVSPRELRVERRSILGTKLRGIPTDELEELQLGKSDQRRVPGSGKVIIARSDVATLEIGRGLGPGELEWVRDVIRFIVTAEG